MAIIFEPLSFIGIDLSSTQVRVIQLNHREKEVPALVAAGSINLYEEEGTAKLSDEQISEKIRELIKEVGIISTHAAIALPEAEVFTRIIEVPDLAPEELNQTIRFEAESYIPYPIDEVQLDWQLLKNGETGVRDGKVKALLIAAPLAVIERYVGIVEAAGLKVIAVETTTIANFRAVCDATMATETLAIVDIGETQCALSVISQGLPALTHNIPIGSNQIRAAIARELGISEVEAEKVKLGLDKLEEEQREEIARGYSSVLDSIIVELRRSIDFYQSQPDGKRVAHIYLTGRGAKLVGLSAYFAQSLAFDVSYANPWRGIHTQATLSHEQLEQMAMAFSVAVGLAMRDEA